jgi:hypothetical protein
MPKDRVILDIRLYESESVCAKGTPLPSNVGRIVQLPKLCYEYGKRIARTLENDAFSVGRPDHVYFNLTPALEEGLFRQSNLDLREVDPGDRIAYVNAGIDPVRVNQLDGESAEDFIIRLVFDGLRMLRDDERSLKLLRKAEQRVREYRTELPILAKEKVTKSYRISIYYKIRPHGRRSVGIIKYEDLKRQLCGEKVFIELEMYSHIYPLVGTISVSQGIVTLKPRASFRSQITVQNYPRPIEIPIARILGSDGATPPCDDGSDAAKHHFGRGEHRGF